MVTAKQGQQTISSTIFFNKLSLPDSKEKKKEESTSSVK
jgi:hypothetical protein